MRTFAQDVRYGLRLLARSPGFTLAAVIALALGIGANTAIFSVVNSVLLRPLPFRDADRMVAVWESSQEQGWNRRIGPSGPNYIDFRDQSRSFEDLAILEPGTGTVTGFGEPQQIPGLRVSTNYLSVLGVKPVLGRDFRPGESWNDRVVIISDKIWERNFGRDPATLHRRVMADGLPYTIVGILPRNWWSPVPADVLVPWADSDLRSRDRTSHDFGVIGHLKPGVSAQQATAELSAIERSIGEKFPQMKGWGVLVLPLQEALAENTRTALLLLLAAVALVLLIACANLANLLLARAAGRGRETAVRLALGAGRGRLVGQFLTESAVLSLLGGAVGLVLALWGVDLLEALVPHTIRLPEGAGEVLRPPILVDARVLVFTLLVSLATSLVFGMAPAFAASRTDVSDALKEGGRSSSHGGRRLRRVFVVSETALALVLLISAALTLKSFWRIRQVNPGFRAERVLAMEMELPTDSKYRTEPEQIEFFRKVLANAQALPGVRSSGATNVLPLDATEGGTTEFVIEGRPLPPGGRLLPADFRAISAGYFQAMGIPLVKGRGLEERDTTGRPLAAVISESLANRYFTDGVSPVGQRIRFGRGVREIVGVVSDVRHSGLDKHPAPTIYVPYLQSGQPRMTLVLRTDVPPAGLIRAAKSAIYAVDKDQPVFKIRTLDEVVADARSAPRFTLLLLGIFAGAALALAAVGIYGVISYVVAQRTREIGVRVALGAGPGDVVRLMVGEGMLLSAAGIAGGLVAAFVFTRWMSGLLYGVSAADPLVFVGAPAFLAVVALTASYLPARRAAKVDASVALRYE